MELDGGYNPGPRPLPECAKQTTWLRRQFDNHPVIAMLQFITVCAMIGLIVRYLIQ